MGKRILSLPCRQLGYEKAMTAVDVAIRTAIKTGAIIASRSISYVLIIILLVLVGLLIAGAVVYVIGRTAVEQSMEKAVRAVEEAEELLAQDVFDPKAAEQKLDEAKKVGASLGNREFDARLRHDEGDYFFELAQSRRRERNLKNAIRCYEEALEVRTVDTDPLGYAMTNVNLGNAYQDLAQVRDLEANLENAIVSYEKALEVYTTEKHPFDYAGTMNNMANAYMRLADVKETEANLEKAIAAYEKVLEIKTADKYPLYFAVTQNNLGSAYQRLAESIKDDKGLEKEIVLSNLLKAVAAYEKAFAIYTTERFGHEHEELERTIKELKSRLKRQ